MRIKAACLIILAFVIFSCATVPITGRKQVHLLPESMMSSMSLTNYQDFLKTNPPVTANDANSILVKKVGLNISAAVERYMNAHNYADRVAGYKWEFNLVSSKEANAWCMPGGKVVVYTGILPYSKDEAGLAVVMGHEIAHAIAQHGNERMSQELAVQAVGVSIEAFMQQKPQQTHDIFMAAFGVGSQLGTLAYSRSHESEADKLGLVFMTMAGYDPARAISFWQDMKSMGGAKPPVLLSTHPSDDQRISDIQAYLPEARKYAGK
jgi:predicted Zn-dependent protease